MVIDVSIRRLCYCLFLQSLHYLTCAAISPALYPPLNRLVKHLAENGTLPHCTTSTCRQTTTQAEFSTTHFTHKQLLALSLNSTSQPTREPYLVSSTGIYRGKRIRYRKRYVDQFLGIYYAEPPKPLQKPMKKRFSYVLQDGTRFSPCCLQSILLAENLSYGSFAMQPTFSDDCLSLNIYRADLRYGEKRKAIMLFSHGGSNQLGSGSLFDGSVLAAEGDIIVITMNFRLNYHGFLSSGDHRIKGNYGLWDQLFAVEWIYENAHLFGGDPHRIVMAGHSAGAGNVMLIPASPHSRGMIRRVISQSGTGLAPWSINNNPKTLLQRFTKDYNCTRADDQDMIDCIYELLDQHKMDIYQLHLSMAIGDDNPYPVVDNDFINDTIANLLQSDTFKNVDFLTGVTLSEGLYFAEYHIKHLYNNLQNQSSSTIRMPPKRKRSASRTNATAIIAPDITYSTNRDNERRRGETTRFEQATTTTEQPAVSELQLLLDRFVRLGYVDRYITANFKQAACLTDRVKQRYERQAQDDPIGRLQLYIELVSDLMFNFDMVRCLNFHVNAPNRNSTNFAYIYSHRPTFKVRSTFRDQLKILPQAVGHFAELDYVFGVPLARHYPFIHQNVNKNYYNHTRDEINFSRQIIRYWSNFIKTGNPNQNPSSAVVPETEWKPYTDTDHNYLYFALNDLHNRPKYFDSMYDFWLECFQIEIRGGCPTLTKRIQQHLLTVVIVLTILFALVLFYLVWKYCFVGKRGRSPANDSPTVLLPHPNRVLA